MVSTLSGMPGNVRKNNSGKVKKKWDFPLKCQDFLRFLEKNKFKFPALEFGSKSLDKDLRW